MKLTRAVVSHPRGTLILFISIIIFGCVAAASLKRDLFPRIEYPVLTVVTRLENKSPSEIRSLVTIPLEEILSTTAGLRSVRSVSRYGESRITLSFDWGTAMDALYMETREKLDYARGILPQGTTRPVALRFDPNSEPVMTIGIEALDKALSGNIRAYARRNIKPALERLPGVAYVDTVGGGEKEILVRVSLERLSANSLGVEEVVRAIEENHAEYPVGSITENNKELSVVVRGRLTGPPAISGLVAGRGENGVPIYLHQVADVFVTNKKQDVIFQLSGREGAALQVYREGGANIVHTADSLRAALPEIRERFSKDVSLKVLYDGSEAVRASLSDIITSALIGIFLTFFVLYFFLEDVVSSVIVGLAIPISIVMTLFSMYLLDISLNLISLAGLSIGIGAMVDSNIVILENIRRRQALDGTDAVYKGASEVTIPVITSIITNIAVFLPVVFVQGIASSIFRELALVVTFSHLSTLLTSVMLTPALVRLTERKDTNMPRAGKERFQGITEGAGRVYTAALSKLLPHTNKAFLILAVLSAAAAFIFLLCPKEVLPPLPDSTVNIRTVLPPGSSLETTRAAVSRMELSIRRMGFVESCYSLIGAPENTGGYSSAGRTHMAETIVLFKRGQDYRRAASILKEGLWAAPGSRVTVQENRNAFSRLFPAGNQVLFTGSPQNYLADIAEKYAQKLKNMGVSNAAAGSEQSLTLEWGFDRAALFNSGLSTRQAADTALTLLNGRTVTRVTAAGADIDVTVRADTAGTRAEDLLYYLTVKGPDGSILPLGTLGTLSNAESTLEEHRYNQQDMASVTFEQPGFDPVRAERLVKDMKLPKNVNASYSWQSPEIQASIESLFLAFILSLVVIFTIIAFEFESIVKALLIMSSIPLVFIGLSPVMAVLHISINVVSLLGVILLVGIVVDNGIVLIDFFEQDKSPALTDQALRQRVLSGCRARFRPIMMTSLTTFISLLPLILFPGEGMEFQKILSVTVAAGFAVSTVITLFFLPAAYYALEKRKLPHEVD